MQQGTSLLTHGNMGHGTFAEALLKIYNPEVSVFGESIPCANTRSNVRALAYLAPVVKFRSRPTIEGLLKDAPRFGNGASSWAS